MSLGDDGNVYRKRWDGQYREEQGLFGPKKDTTVWGTPNVERDVLGQPKPERDFQDNQRLIGTQSDTHGGGFAPKVAWLGTDTEVPAREACVRFAFVS